MNLPLFKPRRLWLFLIWVLWIPVILFCSELIISGRNGSNLHFVLIAIVFLTMLLGIRWLSKRLDNSLPSAKHKISRIGKQFFYGMLVPLVTFIILLLVYDKLIDERAVQQIHVLNELYIFMMFFYLANSFYLVIHMDRQFLLTTVKVEDVKHFHEKVLAYHKGAYVPINLMEIALIYQRGQINWIITFEEEEHILDLSLKEIQEILSSYHFFKINRNQIVHKDAIHKFNAGSYGKIIIEMKIRSMTSTVSKDRARDFRKWFYK